MSCLCRAAAGIGLAFASLSACAQYPAKPVRLVLGITAGGPADSVARVVAQGLSRVLGQPVIVENRPGANGAIAAEAVLNSAPDGHTLLSGGSGSMVGVPVLRRNPPYDPASFTPVSSIARFPQFLFSYAGVPARTVSELIEYSRANPGKLSCATAVFPDVVALAQLMKAGGTKMTRVPYKGGMQVISDLVAGRVDVAVAPASLGLPHVKEGRLRALAVFLHQRSPAAPEVPTMAEAGIPGAFVAWSAVLGPPKMPGEIAERLSRELNEVLKQPEVRMHFDRLGILGEGSTPQELAVFLKDELEKARQLVREFEIPLE